MKLFDLTHKNALITGGTHGLGMAIAEALAQAGAQLIITGTTPSKMDEAISYYKSKGYQATGYLFDVTDEIDAAKHVELISKEIGDIHILVNNAGIIKRELAITMPVADFRKVIDVDLVGPFIMSQLVAKQMIERKEGKIINIHHSFLPGFKGANPYAQAHARGFPHVARPLAFQLGGQLVDLKGHELIDGDPVAPLQQVQRIDPRF